MSKSLLKYLMPALLLGMALPALATDLHVPSEYATIQEAIDQATDGDTILVAPGDYSGPFDFKGKDVTLQSEVLGAARLLRGDPLVQSVVNIGPGGTLRDFVVAAGMVQVFGNGSQIVGNRFGMATATNPSMAIYGIDASPLIERNNFIGYPPGPFAQSMVAFTGNSSPVIVNNRFRDHSGWAISMWLNDGNTAFVANNTIARVESGVLLYTYGSGSAANQVYRNNIIVGCNAGLNVNWGTAPTWQHNLVWSNSINYLNAPDLTGVDGNISAPPGFNIYAAVDFRLPPSSVAIDAGSEDGAPLIDNDGAPRPLDGNGDSIAATDIGAYEFDPSRLATDTTPPTTSLVQGSGSNAARITFFAFDFDVALGSGVAATYYTLNGVDMGQHDGAIILGEGQYDFTFYSVDNAGNIEDSHSRTVYIDTQPPFTSLSVSGWPRTVTLEASDTGSGVAGTFYTFDGYNWIPYEGPFVIPEGQDAGIGYFSKDYADNHEEVRYAYVSSIDWSPPYAWAEVFGSQVNGYYADPVTVRLNAFDYESGVAATFYSVDSGEEQLYTGDFEVSGNGLHTITFRAVDNAGNWSWDQYAWVDIDASGPEFIASATIQQQGKKKDSLIPVQVSGFAFDLRSGLDPYSATYSVEDEYGSVQLAGRVSLFPDGGFDFVILLSPAVSKDKDGRTFKIVLSGRDVIGNVGSQEVSIVIPRR